MKHRYGVLGAGRQGVAAAYDLAMHGDAAAVVLADVNAVAARRGAERVNALAGRDVAGGEHIDVSDTAALHDFMSPLDVCLSAVPYPLNLALTRAAIAAGCGFCDLGGNSDVVHAQLGLDAQARAAGVAVVPDCGVGPGLISNLAVHAIETLDTADELRIYDGGLPETPHPPFNYKLFFNVGGLTNEYDGDALYLRDGTITPVPCFDDSEYELVDIPELGELEAFVTSGALTTMAHTYEGRLRTLTNKTLRYPGHAALLKGIRDLGMLEMTPLRIGEEQEVVPRDFLHEVLARAFAPGPEDRDVMVIHMVASGTKDGRPATVTIDLLDRFDAATGFAAMERTTGFHMAIVAGLIARREIEPGATPLERAVPAAAMIAALRDRDMEPRVSIRTS